MPKKYYGVIAGNIGSGKSSLTQLLGKEFGWTPYYESVDDNPYLKDFYADMKRWSFHIQIYFLSKRFIHQKNFLSKEESIIQDRSIYEDAEIFARNLYNIGMMEERDFRNYCELFAAMTSYLQPPDFLIYLRSSVPELQRKISQRGREFEKGITAEYLGQLNSLYESWIRRYTAGKLLIFEADILDFINRREDLERIIQDIHKTLTTI
ncbi:MAG: deoxynucleoside kinase [Bacteroidota bacterium]